MWTYEDKPLRKKRSLSKNKKKQTKDKNIAATARIELHETDASIDEKGRQLESWLDMLRSDKS